MATFTLSYVGSEASHAEIDFYDVARAMLGFQRSLALTVHLVQNGEIITQANDSEIKLLTCSLDRSRNEQVRRIWPYLRDRRIDAYGDLSKRFID